ncbi:hypothetical protein [Teichococcus vastitatis]|uniref:hypothetical protein n=1 Tax=Teichococcus vastitatis TaxID=2307076 RepID=UPI001300793F|nr:hypothetical protein [Pseudoroseomonas vastitatis]
MSQKHSPRIIERGEKVTDWTVYEYRGTTVRHSQSTAILKLPGHPYDGLSAWGNAEAVFRIIAAWVDEQTLPPPYRMRGQ